MDGDPQVRLERTGAVAHLVLDNPTTRNGMTLGIAEALCGHLAALQADPGVRAIVLRGAAGHFCSGADLRASAGLRDLPEAEIEKVVLDLHRLIEAIATCAKPTLAKIEGACAGFGLSVALACDLRVAAADANLAIAFTRIGLHQDGGMSWLLPRAVGYARATELILFSEKLDGTRAAELGLVHRAVAPAELDAFAADWAERLAAGPPIAYRLAKENLRFGVDATLRQVLDKEAHTQPACIKSNDAVRGIGAFFSRQPAKFEGD